MAGKIDALLYLSKSALPNTVTVTGKFFKAAFFSKALTVTANKSSPVAFNSTTLFCPLVNTVVKDSYPTCEKITLHFSDELLNSNNPLASVTANTLLSTERLTPCKGFACSLLTTLPLNTNWE